MKKLGLFVMPFVAASFLVGCGGNTPPGPTPTGNYRFIFDGKNHCTANNLSSYDNDTKVDFTITANDGYVLPKEITVEGLQQYTYAPDENEKTATFSCTMPAHIVKVTVDPEVLYAFSFNGTNCTANNKEGYKEGATVSFAITAEKGYVLPDSITVSGTTTYEYNLADDKTTATFACTMPKGTVSVKVVAREPEPDSYKFEFTHSGCNTTYEFKDKYLEGDEISFTINIEDDYLLPETIEVTGTKEYTYTRAEDKKSATFACTMPASNVSIKVIATYTAPAGEYTMTFVGTNCTANNAKSYVEGTEVQFTITAKEDGYTLPTTIDVTGVSTYTYTLAEGNKSATFACTMPNQNVTVTVKAIDPIPTHSFTFAGEHCSVSPTPKAKYEEGEQILFTITADDEDYVLPNSITVGGVTSYEYTLAANKMTATFTCSMSTNDITVTVGAVSAIHQFTFTGTHCTISEGPTSYREGTLVQLTITAETDYELPSVDKVEVEGLTDFDSTNNYVLSDDKLTAALVFVMPDKDVTIKVEAAKPLYTFHFDGTNCKVNGNEEYKKSDATKGESVSITINPDEGYVLPNKADITVNGVTDYTYTILGGDATFTCTMPGNDVKVIVTAIEPAQTPDYLCFTCKSDTGTLSYKVTTSSERPYNVNLEYSNNGKSWTTADPILTKDTAVTIYEFKKGESIYIRGDNPTGISTNRYNYASFVTSEGSDFAVSGDIMSLFYKEDFITKDTPPNDYCFVTLFDSCNISDASELVLPGLPTKYCYQGLFNMCRKLTSVPAINATSLSEGCCISMFYGCTGLTSVPSNYLSDYEELAPDCYNSMFTYCISLTEVPELPAEELKESCYSGMFKSCSSLKQSPELPATTLAYQCYTYMFSRSGIIEAPELTAGTLAESCYESMFEDCEYLTKAPALPAMNLAESCYNAMFQGCTALEKAPEQLPAETLAENCYQYMFFECESLTTVPESLPAVQLQKYCYDGMFAYCTALTYAPILSATTLADACCKDMFSQCQNLLIYEDDVSGEHVKIFDCPENASEIYDSVSNMFSMTKFAVGCFTGTPNPGHSYYC